MQERYLLVEKTVTDLLTAKRYTTLRDILTTMNPTDVAMLFADLEQQQLPLLFRLLPKELAADTFVEMEAEAQALLIRSFSDNELKLLVDELRLADLPLLAKALLESYLRYTGEVARYLM